jgi:osmotically-inducible protein OsmY
VIRRARGPVRAALLAFLATGVAVLGACSPVGVGVGAGATAGVVAAQERPVGEAISDTAIDLEINEALFQAHIDDLFREVNVDVVEGRVLLTGTVRDQELVDRAGRIAWKVDGVKQVINEIRVGDDTAVDSVRDRWITAKLRGHLLSDTDVLDINYSITTVNGTVYLIGIAQNQAELDRVISHARNLEHVRRVVSHVVLKDDAQRRG